MSTKVSKKIARKSESDKSESVNMLVANKARNTDYVLIARGQRDYKEKFNPKWSDKFLIYNQDYDLLQAPMVLSKIIRL